MKVKKAVKRLDRVESLLSGIIDKYDAAGDHRLQELLMAAKESVVHAKETLHMHSSSTAKKSPRAALLARPPGASPQKAGNGCLLLQNDDGRQQSARVFML